MRGEKLYCESDGVRKGKRRLARRWEHDRVYLLMGIPTTLLPDTPLPFPCCPWGSDVSFYGGIYPTEGIAYAEQLTGGQGANTLAPSSVPCRHTKGRAGVSIGEPSQLPGRFSANEPRRHRLASLGSGLILSFACWNCGQATQKSDRHRLRRGGSTSAFQA